MIGGHGTGCGTGINDDIWYNFTAPADGSIVVDTCGLIDFDSNVEVYEGACDALMVVGGSCDTTGCPGFSATSDPISVTAGTVYKIRVGAWNTSDGGSGVFNISFAPAGDECDDAIIVGEGVHPLDNTLATDSAEVIDDSQCPFTSVTEGNPDIWYSYTPTESCRVTVTTCDLAGFDTDLAIYTGACDALVQIACNGDGPSNDDCQSFYSTITLDVTAGTEYLIRVGGWQGATGTGTLTIDVLQKFIRGDVNQDGGVSIADPIRIFQILFQGFPSSCANAENANNDSSVDIADGVYLLDALFNGIDFINPFPFCGNADGDDLGCDVHNSCP